MNKSEINQELEKLSSEFKISVSNHFKSKNINVELSSLDFSILNESIEPNNEIKALEVNKNDSKNEIILASCRVNKQGQVICS